MFDRKVSLLGGIQSGFGGGGVQNTARPEARWGSDIWRIVEFKEWQELVDAPCPWNHLWKCVWTVSMHTVMFRHRKGLKTHLGEAGAYFHWFHGALLIAQVAPFTRDIDAKGWSFPWVVRQEYMSQGRTPCCPWHHGALSIVIMTFLKSR